ncbi:hypothetical protein B296_00055097 [Ensete ventricosum]|uniref:Uncharacterized protein n=1 Tax=Ensete ventricosum TaxID=4639 RepID=A0A426WYC7_ENSVE|nr:hypothetical protein B296_00055097 [Ensete ventricosum]
MRGEENKTSSHCAGRRKRSDIAAAIKKEKSEGRRRRGPAPSSFLPTHLLPATLSPVPLPSHCRSPCRTSLPFSLPGHHLLSSSTVGSPTPATVATGQPSVALLCRSPRRTLLPRYCQSPASLLSSPRKLPLPSLLLPSRVLLYRTPRCYLPPVPPCHCRRPACGIAQPAVARPSPLPPLPQRCRAQQRCCCCLPATLSRCLRRTVAPLLPPDLPAASHLVACVAAQPRRQRPTPYRLALLPSLSQQLSAPAILNHRLLSSSSRAHRRRCRRPPPTPPPLLKCCLPLS